MQTFDRKLPQPTRHERHIARLVAKLHKLLTRRSQALRWGGRRCEPMARLMKELGYGLNARNPYGRTQQREDVLEALRALQRAGEWQIELRSLLDLDEPLGQSKDDFADTVWVLYIRRRANA